jgi:hypothetical protein
VTSQPNPIPARIRGRILVAAIITGGATGTVTGAMVALDTSPEWIAVAASALAAVGTVAAALSRANLTLDPPDEGA